MPAIVDEKMWIPELDREDLLYHRLFLAEKWLVLKLRYGHADPRDAGIGNIVNCGAAMYIAPVGIANAGDPRRAYDEALDLTAAHQSSYGREAAGVLAAAVAAAMQVDATPETVVETCLAARQGRDADGDRGGGGRRCEARRLARRRPRGAAGGRSRPSTRSASTTPTPALNARIPSRLHAIEELPIALGLLVATGGDYEETVLGGVNYGRDSDSIASMGGALAGALGNPLRRDWVDEVSAASKIDVEDGGRRDGRRRRGDLRQGPPAPPGAGAGTGRPHRRRGACLRVTWVQPEDLVGHELRQAREEGKDVDGVEAALVRGGRRACSRTRRLPGAGRAGAAVACARTARRARRAAPAAGGGRAGRVRGDPRRGRSSGQAGGARPARRGSPARGSAARPAVCSASRSRTSRAPGSARSRRRRATGRCAAGSPPRACRRRSRSAGRGTGPAARRASRRTSPGSPRTTTSTSRCSASRCSSAAAPASTRSTSPRSGSTTCRRGGSSPPSGSPCATCSRRICRRRRRRGATPSASGSARRLRVDAYGWAAPGDPVAAARMAWEDARVSHTANGVYAAMFMASAHAASVAGVVSGGLRGRRSLGRSG